MPQTGAGSAEPWSPHGSAGSVYGSSAPPRDQGGPFCDIRALLSRRYSLPATVACEYEVNPNGIAAAVGNATRGGGPGSLPCSIVSSLLVILAAVYGAASAAFLPRLAHRLAVAFGQDARADCGACGRRFDAWVHAGPACPCSPWSAGVVPTGAATCALLAVAIGPSGMLAVYLLAAVPGLLLAVIDLRCLRLPDRVVGALVLAGAVPSAVLRPERIGPALAAGGLVLTAYLVLALLPRGGLGLGDVKLAAALGLILGFAGWPAVAVGLLAAHLINGPVALFLLFTGRADRRRPLPFGPALLAGALLAVTAT